MKDVVCFDLSHVEIMWGRMWKAKMHKRFRKVFEDASIRKQCTLHIWKATCNLFTIDKIENMNKTIRNGFSTTAHYRCLIQNLLDLKKSLEYVYPILHFNNQYYLLNNGTNWVEYDLSIFSGPDVVMRSTGKFANPALFEPKLQLITDSQNIKINAKIGFFYV